MIGSTHRTKQDLTTNVVERIRPAAGGGFGPPGTGATCCGLGSEGNELGIWGGNWFAQHSPDSHPFAEPPWDPHPTPLHQRAPSGLFVFSDPAKSRRRRSFARKGSPGVRAAGGTGIQPLPGRARGPVIRSSGGDGPGVFPGHKALLYFCEPGRRMDGGAGGSRRGPQRTGVLRQRVRAKGRHEV